MVLLFSLSVVSDDSQVVSCDPMDYGTPGFTVLHHPLDIFQTHFH